MGAGSARVGVLRFGACGDKVSVASEGRVVGSSFREAVDELIARNTRVRADM